ncbi:CMP-N-acetylneuraminate-beta-galactosamide-alpha-2,3-sialyltransferase 2-like [Hippocampus comes]|uniref:CMP-N-acetylneuraminate-beta-galactosamide- alpha-2,3-sialyltransferase 2-like n=1 Tax=Hippocampus comes TaxID=109280 RepID=UPI00094E7A67|nr:PREDICTED: CMP-N-acetylneuraminate-beta-galactosamide-alpha-2,3-sialyltransferase 2-like [Hippocampus comes]
MRLAGMLTGPRPLAPPAMLSKRKACVALGIAALVLLMLASQSIQRKHFLSLSVATPTRDNVSQETELPADVGGPQKLVSTAPLDKLAQGDAGQDARPCGCPESCVSDLSESDWFRRRYDPRQRPVLRNAKDRLNPDALNWWLVRTARRTSKTHAVHTIFANIVETNLTCARPIPVFPLRMNKAVTRGFEKDVGNRTTHHFVYPESAVDVGRGVSLILLPFKLRDMEWLSSALSTGHVKMTYMRVRVRVEADKDKVLVVSPAFFKYVHERWTERHGRYPSTGMLAIVFALHICDQVSVFGYGADKQGNWHHYWEENRYAGAFRKTGVHSADFEMQVIRQLAEEGRA